MLLFLQFTSITILCGESILKFKINPELKKYELDHTFFESICEFYFISVKRAYQNNIKEVCAMIKFMFTGFDAVKYVKYYCKKENLINKDTKKGSQNYRNFTKQFADFENIFHSDLNDFSDINDLKQKLIINYIISHIIDTNKTKIEQLNQITFKNNYFEQFNLIYNACDLILNIPKNEGFGFGNIFDVTIKCFNKVKDTFYLTKSSIKKDVLIVTLRDLYNVYTLILSLNTSINVYIQKKYYLTCLEDDELCDNVDFKAFHRFDKIKCEKLQNFTTISLFLFYSFCNAFASLGPDFTTENF